MISFDDKLQPLLGKKTADVRTLGSYGGVANGLTVSTVGIVPEPLESTSS